MNTIKTFWLFWQPAPNKLAGMLRVELALLERRRSAILRKMSLQRVRLAATESAIEQIQQELQQIPEARAT